MSYIRYGSVYRYVDGFSRDYIFPSTYTDENGKEVMFIEDYDKITNESIVEFIARYVETDFPEFKEYLIKELAKKLNVKLRDKPLTSEEAFNLTCDKMKEDMK